jgi:hypothetical protein
MPHYARAIQSRIDLIEDEMSTLERRGAAHFECARLCLADIDSLATSRFQLLVAMARIEHCLVQPAPTRKANGRAVA